MSIGLVKGTVSLEPHNSQWEIMAKETIEKLTRILGDDMVAEALGMRVFLLTDCLINKTDRAVDEFKHGNFDDLRKYIEELI